MLDAMHRIPIIELSANKPTRKDIIVTLPIFDSSNGRTIIGMATGIRSATIQIRRLITIPAGFTLHVWQRSKADIDMTDVCEMPDGFCYSVSYRY